MAGGIDEVIDIVLAVLCRIIELNCARLDGDSALALEIHIIEDLRLHIARGDRSGLLKDTVGESGLAVVDMSNY